MKYYKIIKEKSIIGIGSTRNDIPKKSDKFSYKEISKEMYYNLRDKKNIPTYSK